MVQSICDRIKQTFHDRKKRIMLAGVFFVLEFMLLVWPVGWISEDVEITPDSGDMWLERMTEERSGFCQEFIPRYDRLNSISLFFSDMEQSLGEGEVSVVLSDERDEILFQKTYTYSTLKYNLYMDVETKLDLQAGKTYYLTVNVYGESGEMPSMALCGNTQTSAENQSLTWGDEAVDGQLLMRYSYADAMTRRSFVKALILCLVTAAGVAFGVPKNKYVRTVLGSGILLAWPFVLGLRLERLSLHTFEMLPVAVRWTVILMYLIEAVILLCTLSWRAAIAIISLAMTLIYSINYFVYLYRGIPLKVSDIAAARTVARVVDAYSFRPNHALAVVWAIALALLVYGLQTGKVEMKTNWILRGTGILAGVALAIGMGYWLLYTDFIDNAGFQGAQGFGQNNVYEFNGYIIGTCMDIQRSRVRTPEGYSCERVEELLREAVEKADCMVKDGTGSVTGNAADQSGGESGGDYPHVILIMNESFADLRALGDLELSEENLPFINSLRENTIRGYVNASVLGGGTANSEFEVFTGCSMGILPKAYYPYLQIIKRPLPSLVSNMKDLGYTTWSMHPESKVSWNRVNVYKYLGFENSLWMEDFEGAEVLHMGVSDAETYRKAEELFEQRAEGERLFVFDLTMQNHGGYAYDKTVQRTVRALGQSCDEADVFLSLIRESDKAFEQLVSYFEQQEEKVVICMFGDHQPKFGDESFYQAVYSRTDGLTEEDKRWNQYKTPFLIWANYDIEEADGLDIGMNYLGVLMQKTAGVPLSPFFAFLSDQMKDYPVMSLNGYKDAAGDVCRWSEKEDEFPEYRILQYNYLFDPSHTVEWGY